MTSPDWSKAEVDPRKLTDYLLDLEHPVGRSKAIFFIRCGFSSSMWWQLADALKTHTTTAAITNRIRTEFGWKFVLEGMIETPSRGSQNIRSIWVILDGLPNPKFISAYPLR